SRHPMSLRTKILIFAAVFIIAAAAFATQKSLKVDVDLVLFNVSVNDANNRFVSGLTAENFQVFEDKVEQKIRYFSSDVAPVSLGIIFDISHSMQKKLEFAREAATTFLESGTPDDEYFLVEFASRANVAQGFTTDISRLRDRLAFRPAEGATALY